MSETKIPGLAAVHAIIKPECRELRGDHGAIDEAIRRVRLQYDGIVNGWKGESAQPTFRLVLTVERPVEEAP